MDTARRASTADVVDAMTTVEDGSGSATTEDQTSPAIDSAALPQDIALDDSSAAVDASSTDTSPLGDSVADTTSDATADVGLSADIAIAPDVAMTKDTSAADTKAMGVGSGLYAQTSTHLYRLDPVKKAFVLIGKFNFDKLGGSVTDIALDDGDSLYAVTFNNVFSCSHVTAKCKWLAKLPTSFNGLTFVPKGTVEPNKDALIGIGNDGSWNHIVIKGNTATVKKLGSYGSGYTSSGDAFSVKGVGTFATVVKGAGGDKLIEVDPKTGKLIKLVGNIGASSLWGFAWSNSVFYGFSSNGKVYRIDEATGAGTPLAGITIPIGVSWWGAGVSTRAAGF